jgi:C-terminal processing protease CtpA/Prc
MRMFLVATLAAVSLMPVFAQLSVEQKQEDFRQLAALYAKQYAFYEWKRDAVGFDLLKVQPWLDKIAQTTDDLGYYELAAQYVGSLKDGHDTYLNPSDFVADLRFRVDIYDGKVLVDALDRKALPARQYDIQVGDELVSIDGKTPEDYISDFSKYYPDGSLRSTRRDAVVLSSVRPQQLNPRAAIVGDTAAVVLQSKDGTQKNLTIPWVKSGTLFTTIGPVPNTYSKPPGVSALAQTAEWTGPGALRAVNRRFPAGGVGEQTSGISGPSQVLYRKLTRRFQNMRKEIHPDILNVGSVAPIYLKGLPSTFVQRLGTRSSDFFFSGIYTASGKKIGIIRIPDFCGSDPACSVDFLDSAVAQFQREITYMKQNTDALVVDVSRNPGGYGFYGLQLLDRLTDKPYTHAGFILRPQYADVVNLNQALDPTNPFGLEQWQLDATRAFRDEILQAYQSNRGLTGPLPIDFGYSSDPADVPAYSFSHPALVDASGKAIGYDKPVLCLVDEGSYSAAELFSSAFQDAKRGPVMGMGTGGLGGGRSDVTTGIYSEAATSVTVTQLLRSQPIANPDFMAAPYIENIGVRPDLALDFMTVDNLSSGGMAYVNAFTAAVVNLLGK